MVNAKHSVLYSGKYSVIEGEVFERTKEPPKSKKFILSIALSHTRSNIKETYRNDIDLILDLQSIVHVTICNT